MKIPVEISTRNLNLTNGLEDLIRAKADKLDTFYDGIIRCRVMVEVPHRRQRKGVTYNVRLDISVPGSELVVKREPHEDLHVAIVNAFDVAERRVKEFAERQRGEVKIHFEKPMARVSKLFLDEGYGFLMSPDGREIYFHQNAVLSGKFEDMKVGTVVNYVEQLGEKGAQASSVSVA